jgi:nitrogen-specific signal transduction histidine kinase
MSNSVALAQPILVDVDADGRLVRADGPVLRLHLLAGGQDGGTLAIPSLAALATATHKFQMRLARAIKVADEDEDIELWVETQLIDSIARLKIIGWRSELKMADKLDREEQIDRMGGTVELLFNQQLLLISVLGDGGNDQIKIGASASDVFQTNDEGNKALLDAMVKHLPIQTVGISVGDAAQQYAVSGEPKRDQTQLFIGYSCHLRPENITKEHTLENEAEHSQIFGMHLGSALRQPLGRIIANAETIGSKLQGPIRDSYATYAKDIADAARHLVTLVDDLGDLEAIERPGFKTAQDSIELGDIARRVAGLLALKAADHSIFINVPTDNKLVPAAAEFRRVLQIMINLVTNAIRYSPDGTLVAITVSQNDEMSDISVTDEGVGIPDEDREKIFNKFERLGRSGDGGSGLGLYISRRLARAMGGDLTVTAAEQGGSKFTLTLPRS